MFGLMSGNTECIMYSLFDLLTKLVYASLLCDSHLVSLSKEDFFREELELKQHAIEAQHHFLRYVLHEVIIKSSFNYTSRK